MSERPPINARYRWAYVDSVPLGGGVFICPPEQHPVWRRDHLRDFHGFSGMPLKLLEPWQIEGLHDIMHAQHPMPKLHGHAPHTRFAANHEPRGPR